MIQTFFTVQVASEKVTNGKIKGLFCCLPQDHFYAFSVFGLYAQVVPYRATPNLHQLSGELFSTAWFHAEPPAGSLATLFVAGIMLLLALQLLVCSASKKVIPNCSAPHHSSRFSSFVCRNSQFYPAEHRGRACSEGGWYRRQACRAARRPHHLRHR